jgi:hypothetical protein
LRVARDDPPKYAPVMNVTMGRRREYFIFEKCRKD